MQGIEIGDAVNPQDDGLTIEHKLLDAVLQGGLGDPRIALRPIIAAACDQPHPIAPSAGQLPSWQGSALLRTAHNYFATGGCQKF
jgi:hypothetical protein